MGFKVAEVQSAGLSRRRFLMLAGGTLALAACGGLWGCDNAASSEASLAETGNGVGGDAAPEPLTETVFAFDTVVTLTASCEEALMQQLVDRCSYFEQHFSRTLEGSDIWRINNAQGAPVEVAPETAAAISRGLEFGRLSDGLFDITIGAVSSLWDFKEGIRPDDEQIAEAVRHIDYRGVSVDGTTVTLADPQAMLDLGGIAKGVIADDLAQMLADGGCQSAIINLGGNVFVVGSKPDGSPWRVGIQDPNAPTATAVVASLECAQTSVVTSGLYERTFTEEGVRYHHILDPRTGFPAETDLVSSSIVSASSTEGDAYATWMFLLGHDGALQHIEDTPGLEGMVVDQQNEISMTSGAKFQLS